jgi:hypothetical protein
MFIVMCILILHIYIYISIQQNATVHSIYSLFHCKFTLHVSGAIYTHHQEYKKLSSYTIGTSHCRDRLDNVTSNPLESILNPLNAELNSICHLLTLLGPHHILRVSRVTVNQVTNTLHHSQIKTSS